MNKFWTLLWAVALASATPTLWGDRPTEYMSKTWAIECPEMWWNDSRPNCTHADVLEAIDTVKINLVEWMVDPSCIMEIHTTSSWFMEPWTGNIIITCLWEIENNGTVD